MYHFSEDMQKAIVWAAEAREIHTYLIYAYPKTIAQYHTLIMVVPFQLMQNITLHYILHVLYVVCSLQCYVTFYFCTIVTMGLTYNVRMYICMR